MYLGNPPRNDRPGFGSTDNTQQGSPPEATLPKTDFYQMLRGQVEFTNNLINQRIIWMAISQSFFFGAYVGIANAPEKARGPIFHAQGELLLWLLPVAALIACAASFTTVLAATLDLPRLRKTFEEYCSKLDDPQALPEIEPPLGIRVLEKSATLLMPVLFMVVWAIILWQQQVQAPPPPM